MAFLGGAIVAILVAAASWWMCWLYMRARHDRAGQNWSRRSHYGPKEWPLLGAQVEASRNYHRLLDWITGFFDGDHRTVTIRTLGRKSILTVDPDSVEYILKSNFANFPKGIDLHSRNFDLLGNGILNTDGSLWKSHRKIASMEFSITKLKHLRATVYAKNALKLVNVIARSNQGIDMQEVFLAMTFDSICEVVLGEELDTLSNPHTSPYAAIMKSFDDAQEMIARRHMFPWWRIQRYLNTGSEKILRDELNKFKYFLSGAITKKMLGMQTSNGYTSNATSAPKVVDAPDLLSRFMYQIMGEDFSSKDGLKEVQDAMINFILAGRDTTGATLSWFIYCMCMHQEKQEQIFQELLGLEKSHDQYNQQYNGRTTSYQYSFEEYASLLTYETLQKQTPYLHAAIVETLRLYPAVPRDGKVALQDDVLPDGTILKGGDQVAYVPYAMGRMKFIWGDDALDFKPERWLQNGVFQPPSPFKLTAFQAGPRMCLGKDAAYLQMKTTLALLLRFFRFELVPKHLVTYRMMAIMTMKHGIKVNFSLR